MRLSYYVFPVLLFLTAACSSSKDSTADSGKKEPEVYIFHEVSKPDSAKLEKPFKTESAPVEKQKNDSTVTSPKIIPDAGQQKQESKKFIVQVGAFSTRERAKTFINENQSRVAYTMKITLREQSQLYLVQLPPFSSREEAEKVRNTIWQYPAFKGAFIIAGE